MKIHEIEFRLKPGTGFLNNKILGKLLLSGIESVPIPNVDKYEHLFIRRKFTGHEGTVWRVSSSYIYFDIREKHPIFGFELLEHRESFSEEYLAETASKARLSGKSYLRRGTLVEVDFGFIPSFSSISGKPKKASDCWDVVKQGEMHKRRLCVVLTVGENRAQVLPITSKPVSPADKSAFELSESTLERLWFYGNSGKSSFVLCGLPQTVSFERLLPPTGSGKGSDKKKRNTNYRITISKSEQELMQTCLMNSMGVLAQVEGLKADIAALTAEKNRLLGIEHAIELLEKHLGGGVKDLLEEVLDEKS